MVVQYSLKIFICLLAFWLSLPSYGSNLSKSCDGTNRPQLGQLDLHVIIIKNSQWDDLASLEFIREGFNVAGRVLGLKISIDIENLESDEALYGFGFDSTNFSLMNRLGDKRHLTMIFTGEQPSKLDLRWSGFLSTLTSRMGPFIAYTYSKSFDREDVINEGVVFVNKEDTSYKTFPHELGHLLGSLKHSILTNDLMLPFTNSCELDDESIIKIQTSPYVRRTEN